MIPEKAGSKMALRRLIYKGKTKILCLIRRAETVEVDFSNFPITFNGFIEVEAMPERLTADAGALLLRELDERFEWTTGLALQEPAIATSRPPTWGRVVTHSISLGYDGCGDDPKAVTRYE